MKAAIFFLLLVLCDGLVAQEKNDEARMLLLLEEKVRKATVKEFNIANAYYSDVESEFYGASRQEGLPLKLERLSFVKAKMDSINLITSKLISYLDDAKVKLLAEADENLEEIILRSNDFEAKKMNLFLLKRPMKSILIEDSVQIFRMINKYRDELIFVSSNYNWGGKKYSLGKIEPIKGYDNLDDFHAQLRNRFSDSTYNFREDKFILMDIYSILNTSLLNVVYDRSETLIGNLSLLSALQNDLMSCRTLAIAHWKSKVSTGEYGFNSFVGIVDGPDIIKVGEEHNYNVSFAAINTNVVPKLEVLSPEGVVLGEAVDGKYPITLPPCGKGKIILRGTIAIKSKSGYQRIQNWEKVIEVVE